jgi:hypothetical protein
MSDLGDRVLGSTVDFKFTTSVNGVPTALAGSPAISVYQGGSTSPITSGVTFTGGYNSTTGLNDVSIVASAGNGFAAGNDYQVVITTGTLGGVSMVGYVVGAFSLNLGNVSAGTVTSVTNRVTANSDQIAGSAPAATDLSKTTNAIGRGTVTTGGSTTSVPTSALTLAGSAASGVVASQFVGRTILFDGNTTTAGLQGASASISASTASNTPTLTVGTLPATPASGDTFSII